ncbi:Uncharacterised protein g11114 [Pycnogonum litorale]
MDTNTDIIKFPKKVSKALLVTVLCTSQMFTTMNFTILGSFYPVVAVNIGLTKTEVGIVFAVFHLMNICVGPFLGIMISRIGLRRLFLMSLIVSSAATFSFAFTILANSSRYFLWFSIIIRLIQGASEITMQCCCYTFVATSFDDNVSKIVGLVAISNGLGYTLGPFVGGFLYQYGGYMVTFITPSVITLLLLLIAVIITKAKESENTPHSKKVHISKMLRIPYTHISCSAVLMCAATNSLYDVGIPLYASKQFESTSSQIGLLFGALSFTFLVTGPIFGHLTDKTRLALEFVIVSIFIFILSSLLVGPANFLSLPRSFWITACGMAFAGIASAGIYVPTMELCLIGIREHGVEESLAVTAQVSSLLMTCNAAGAFFSPILSGYLMESYDFTQVATMFAVANLIVMILIILCKLLLKCRCETKDEAAAVLIHQR